jgi:hypothetical protein
MDMSDDGPFSLSQESHETARGFLSIAAALRGPDVSVKARVDVRQPRPWPLPALSEVLGDGSGRRSGPLSVL